MIANYTQVSELFCQKGAVAAQAAGLAPDDEPLLRRALAALKDAESEAAQAAQGEPVSDVLLAPNDQAAALLQTYLAEQALKAGQVEEAHAGALEAKFGINDIGWVVAAIPFIREKFGVSKRDPRPPLSDYVAPLPDQAMIAVLGDWGTGLYGARPCAETIAADGGYHALLHLGDVYYSGSEREIRNYFLDIWKTMCAGSPAAVSRACNSNHEMYSGGGPLFGLTLPHFGQASPSIGSESPSDPGGSVRGTCQLGRLSPAVTVVSLRVSERIIDRPAATLADRSKQWAQRLLPLARSGEKGQVMANMDTFWLR